MSRLIRLFQTSIGSKLVMALSGLMLVAFLIGHMVGNLRIFQGQTALNEYGAWLHGHPLLWVMRLAILVIFVLHVYIGLRLALANRAARPQRYAYSARVQASFAARTMAVSGILILIFLIYHLLHLTLDLVNTEYAHQLDPNGLNDVYSKVVGSFQNPWVSSGYIIAIVLLGLHLHHAIQSLFQTLGFNHESYQTLIHISSLVLVVLLVVGFSSVPVFVLLDVIKLPA